MEQQSGGRVFTEAGYVLGLAADPERLRAPDVSWVPEHNLDRFGARNPRRFMRGAPDLVVEIESAHGPKSLQQRIHDYLDAGTSLVWVIHVETRTATVYRKDRSARVLGPADVLTGEDVLPGLDILLHGLFDAI